MPALDGEGLASVEETVATTAASPREEAISREEQTLLWKALEGIPETYRQPLIMYYWEERSGKGVAEALGIGEEAARVRLHRGRAMLRDQARGFVETRLVRATPGKSLVGAVLAALPATRAEAAFAASGAAAQVAAGTGAGLLPWLLLLVHVMAVNIADTFSRRERRFVLQVTLASVLVATLGLAGLGIVARLLDAANVPIGAAGWVMGLCAAALVGATERWRGTSPRQAVCGMTIHGRLTFCASTRLPRTLATLRPGRDIRHHDPPVLIVPDIIILAGKQTPV